MPEELASFWSGTRKSSRPRKISGNSFLHTLLFILLFFCSLIYFIYKQTFVRTKRQLSLRQVITYPRFRCFKKLKPENTVKPATIKPTETHLLPVAARLPQRTEHGTSRVHADGSADCDTLWQIAGTKIPPIVYLGGGDRACRAMHACRPACPPGDDGGSTRFLCACVRCCGSDRWW